MNLIWRMFLTWLFSRFESRVDLFDESSTNFLVLPTDIDILMHMNNGRYFSFMDLGRTNHMIRGGILHRFRKNDLYPVVASEMIRFKKSVKLFNRFQLTTKLIAWDKKFFYIVHHVKYKNEVYALSLVKACFLKKGGKRVSSPDVLRLVGVSHDPLPIPEWVQQWQQADQTFHDESITNNELDR